MSTSFNILDIIFITFTIIFVLTAFFRGFVKEIFSLLNWVVALTASYFLTPLTTGLLSSYFENALVLDSVTRSVIFILAFIATAMSTSGLRDSLQDKMPKIFDRSLGVLFGFLKTLLIFGFVYSLYFNLYALLLGSKLKETVQEPSWLKEAKCHSLLKFSGTTLDPIVKKFFTSISKNFDEIVPKEKELNDKIDEIVKENNSLDVETKQAQEVTKKATDAKESTTKNVKTDKDAGYSKKDIEKMNHLIDIIDK